MSEPKRMKETPLREARLEVVGTKEDNLILITLNGSGVIWLHHGDAMALAQRLIFGVLTLASPDGKVPTKIACGVLRAEGVEEPHEDNDSALPGEGADQPPD